MSGPNKGFIIKPVHDHQGNTVGGVLTIDDDDSDACSDPGGHSWVYTGTAYGGDDESYFGEGRCYCEFCGAGGDA